MESLDSLKLALWKSAVGLNLSDKQPLSDTQYGTGFDILMRGGGATIYQDFIAPQLSEILRCLLTTRTHVSALEIGPGPKSVLGYLPMDLKHRITRYSAFEPNGVFASHLESWLCSNSETEVPLPGLECPPNIRRFAFSLDTDEASAGSSGEEKFNFILFCHSMYGMKPKSEFIKKALEMLVEQPQGGLVVVVHRDSLRLDGLVCQRTNLFRTGVVYIANDDDTLDSFAPFITGFLSEDRDVRANWRNVCRDLGRCEADSLLFSAPQIVAAITSCAMALPALTEEVPPLDEYKRVKNSQACLLRPAAVVRPEQIYQVQQCVQWALQNDTSLTIVGGGHSGHCLWPNAVAVDMSAFDQVHTIMDDRDSETGPLIVAEAGCKTGDIIRKAMQVGLTVPLGARPSVGAGLWLQGGIGHLARLYGLSCDAIVGAVIVTVGSGEVLNIGHVPGQYRPAGATPSNESDLLWAIKGAGTNFGIVINV